MFKIEKVILNGIDEIKFENDLTFVYGRNNVGKSVLVKCIYFLLGEKSDEEIWKMQGMENVLFLECLIHVDNGFLYLKRSIEHTLFYKYDANDEYSLIDIDNYKEIIQSYISSSSDLFLEYKDATKENLNYRGLVYLNFIDQYALGNITNIFPKASDYRFYKRIKRQMTFFFEYEKLVELNKLIARKSEIDSLMKKYNNNIAKIQFLKDAISKEYRLLSIPFSGDISVDKESFNLFKENSLDFKQGNNKDLVYLLKVSSNLTSQIEIEKTFKNESELLSTRNKRVDLLLNLIKSTIGSNEKYVRYSKSIEKVLNENKTTQDTLSVKDYSLSLKKLISKKIEIDKMINELKSNLEDKDGLSVNKSINIIERYLTEIDETKDIADVNKLVDELNVLDKTIQEKKESIGSSISRELNSFISEKYLNMPIELKFVEEDIKKDNFIMKYIPARVAISGWEDLKNENEKHTVEYYPGSKARRACWQILTYIGIQKYIREHFSSFPLLPLLVIDGINEPFDKESFELVIKYFSSLCEQEKIQLIVTSTQKISCLGLRDITEGLNSKH